MRRTTSGSRSPPVSFLGGGIDEADWEELLHAGGHDENRLLAARDSEFEGMPETEIECYPVERERQALELVSSQRALELERLRL